MDILRKISKVLDIVVFVATTLAIAGVFYEGMTLKWYVRQDLILFFPEKCGLKFGRIFYFMHRPVQGYFPAKAGHGRMPTVCGESQGGRMVSL